LLFYPNQSRDERQIHQDVSTAFQGLRYSHRRRKKPAKAKTYLEANMNNSSTSGGHTRNHGHLGWLTMLLGLFIVLSLAGCGGGSSDSAGGGNGTAVLGLTDAPGDFLTYTVDVQSIKMVHSDGRVVETLPLTTRVDFAQYADLTEFLTAATVPLGAYKEAIVTLDYSNAQIEVEDPDGNAAPVTQILDSTGQPATTLQMHVQLDRNVPIAPGLARYIMFDFNLAKSNTVTLNGNSTSGYTASIQVDPVLIATVDKESPKLHRLRGPLKSVDVAGGTYDVYIRPYFRRILNNTNTYGEFHVHTSSTTVFEIDGITYTGSAGLMTLANEPQYSAVVAIGHLRLNPLRFEADEVHAGSSVPGGDLDVVKGSVIARSGDVVTLRGVTLVRNNGTVVFNDNVTVNLDPSTIVTKELDAGTHSIAEISVGQRITAFGSVTSDSTSDMQFSTLNGYVRMELSQVRGQVTSVPVTSMDYLVMKLTAINGRNPAIYDFTNTQASADSYDVVPGNLDLSGISVNDDIAARGFPTPFDNLGDDDFTAQTLIQYSISP